MRRPAALSPLVAVALLATACPAQNPEPPATGLPTASPTEDPSLTPVAGGTLTVSIRDVASLDPADAVASRGSLQAVTQIFEPLTRIDPLTNEPLPAAAKKWTVSKDGRRWRFTLAKQRFHDGSLVRSTDFKFAFDRLVRRSTRSDAAFQLEQVQGFRRAKIDGTATRLAGVTTPDPFVLVLTLTRPFAELAVNLSHPALVPLPQKTYGRSQKGLSRRPIGNGPFEVAGSSGKRVRLVPAETWEGEQPFLDAVVFQVDTKIERGWRAYKDGDVQVAEVPPTAIDGGSALFGTGGFTPFWATLSFGFNTKKAPFRKAEVRRAVSLAIDRDSIAATVYGNTRDPASGILPSGIRGFVPGACSVCERDLARAQGIIDAAYPKKKPSIGLDFLNERSSKQVAKAIAADIRELGFRVKLRPHARDDYLDVLEGGRHDIAQLGWLADVPSPDGFLHHQLRTNQLNNHTGWSNAQFDRRLDRARREADSTKRLKHYMLAESIALREMPLLPIVFFRNRTAVSPTVHRLVLDGAGMFDATRVWVEA